MVSLPSERFTRFGNPAWPGGRTANFAAFGSWSETLLKNAESLRSSDALMRVAVPRHRGPAGLRDLFCICRNYGFHTLRSGLSACMGQGWYHYPRCALCAAETPDGRLSRGLICRFLRSGGRSSPHDSYFLANTQNFMSTAPVANAFALWYDKFSKVEFIVLFHSYQNSFLTRTMQTAPSKWCTISSSATRTDRSVFPFLKQRVMLWKIVQRAAFFQQAEGVRNDDLSLRGSHL